MSFVAAIAAGVKRVGRAVRRRLLARERVRPEADTDQASAQPEVEIAAPAQDPDERDVFMLARLPPGETLQSGCLTAGLKAHPAGDIQTAYLIQVDLQLNSHPSVHYTYSALESAGRARILHSVGYIHYALSAWVRGPGRLDERRAILGEGARRVFCEAGDTAVHPGTVGYDRVRGEEAVRLIPDVHFYLSSGYEHLGSDSVAPSWNERRPQIVWRGSTTGGAGLDRQSIETLPRYRLCLAVQRFGEAIDAGFTNVVQARSEDDAEALHAQFLSQNIWRDRLEPIEMAQYRHMIDIDGNAGSWGFLEKLLTGACVLKIASTHEQWFYADLTPWTHFVPIENDLSDLDDKIAWCLENGAVCQAIGEAGRAFALERDFATQMAFAAETIVTAAQPV